jgi:hypothetical protein
MYLAVKTEIKIIYPKMPINTAKVFEKNIIPILAMML